MRQPKTKVNGIAMLKNVTAVTEAMEHAVNRPSYLPGLVVFSGASGLGKTSSAIWMANEMRAYHVEMDSSCTRKELLLDILSEMGIHAPGRTIREMKHQIGEELALSRRPLIIDDAQYAVQRGMIELILDIHKKSGEAGTILLIGEEALRHALKRWERIDNRVLRWIEAKPLDLADAAILRDTHIVGVTIRDDLLAHLHGLHKGCARRICVGLEEARELAVNRGLRTIGLGDFRAEAAEAPALRGVA